MAIKCYKIFRRERQRKRVKGIDLCVKKWIECKKLPLRNCHEQVESLWVKNQG